MLFSKKVLVQALLVTVNIFNSKQKFRRIKSMRNPHKFLAYFFYIITLIYHHQVYYTFCLISDYR